MQKDTRINLELGWLNKALNEPEPSTEEQAEKYRSLLKSLGNMSNKHPEIWDSRNIGQ